MDLNGGGVASPGEGQGGFPRLTENKKQCEGAIKHFVKIFRGDCNFICNSLRNINIRTTKMRRYVLRVTTQSRSIAGFASSSPSSAAALAVRAAQIYGFAPLSFFLRCQPDSWSRLSSSHTKLFSGPSTPSINHHGCDAMPSGNMRKARRTTSTMLLSTRGQ